VFVRILAKLLRDKTIGQNIVPIIPDEARTFGLDALFRTAGIYSSKGQLYDPVDSESFLYYREDKKGQILELGINEVGSMASFIAAGTSYANFGINMIPFYTYYSMFGFQRVGDLMWCAGDSRSKGFLLGATAWRTTLNGEGLQHQDGHSHLVATTIPNFMSYEPAFAYELAVIIQNGLKRMYQDMEEIVYYISLHNENYCMPAMPNGSEEGILKGMYRFNEGPSGKKNKVHLLGSGAIVSSALKAQEILAEKYDVSADVWSITSYKRLRSEALAAQRWNMLHPKEPPRKSFLEKTLSKETGVFVGVSDNVKLVSDQISGWVPGGLFSLGTDGFGRSDTRENLRRFFEIDAECTVVGTLYALSQRDKVSKDVVADAIKELNVDPDKDFPFCL